jgi:hypothetical protein
MSALKSYRYFASLAGLIFVACLPAALAAASNSAKPAVITADVAFCAGVNSECNSAFDTRLIRDLYIFATWHYLEGTHTQTLRFILPDGNVYGTMEAPLSGVSKLRPHKDSPVVAMSVLPVAGTYITQHSLFGKWTVQVLLDGNLATQADFILQ